MKPRKRSFEKVDALVNANVGLAYHFANQFWRLGQNEALSIALEGLLAAARDWDPKGCNFGTYASLRIKWTFSLHYRRTLSQRRGGGIPHLSLQAPTATDSNFCVGDSIVDEAALPPNDEVEEAQEIVGVEQYLDFLSDKQRLVLKMRFGIGRPKLTLEESGRILGVTRERVRQVQNEAIYKLNKIRFGKDRVKGAVVDLGTPRHLWNRHAAKPEEKRDRLNFAARLPNHHAVNLTDFYVRNQISRKTKGDPSKITDAEIKAWREKITAKRIKWGRINSPAPLQACA